MKTYPSSDHYNESIHHNVSDLPAGISHAAMRQFVSIAAFVALFIVITFTIKNATTVEQHPGHFLARVTH